MGLWGRMYLGVFVRASVGGGLEGRGASMGGVRGDKVTGKAGRGIVGRSVGGMKGCPLISRVSGKNLSWSIGM